MQGKGLVLEVGARIAARRKAAGLTQAQVAEAIGVEKETISRMENGVISPTLSRLQQIADLLGCSLSDLFRGEDLLDSEHSVVIGELIQTLPESDRAIVVKFVVEVVKVLRTR